MSRAVTVLGVAVVLLLLAELAAVPLATRVLSRSLADCLPHERLTVERVARPVLPGLLLGRARDVELVADGVQVGALRIDAARARLDRAVLPWAPGDPATGDVVLDVRVTEADLGRALRAYAPLGVPLTVELEPGVATVGAEHLPVTVRLQAAVEDGELRVRPVDGDGAWWERLGFAAALEGPDGLDVRAASIGAGRLTGTARLAALPGADGVGCDRPIGAGT